MTFSEAAAEVIRLADARQAYWNRELPKRHADYPIIRAGDRPVQPPPEDQQLRNVLAGLPADVVYKLILTMYLGRDEFGTAGLGERYAEMKRAFPMPEIAASQLAGKVPLGDYVRDGLAKLERAGIDLDHAAL